ncbi:2-nitropropane dioxygenase NPD [Pseudofrankia inefficax]|uniref:2-nitropropane dioxygenase NPD n=2 Tax=Pseudofrankia inefficax (strain DSM 45817 / CECT 9037 / DDB 130130 / EuI1c) TaxID=298654 RepID=E3JAN9_PSEI1|nr:2-nitropropane dioxygenase NPD [Pseudofrankia inefficax]
MRCLSGMRLPLVAAPMTQVSTPALVAAARAAGVAGAFPTSNCRTSAELDDWFDEIDATTSALSSGPVGPLAANLIVHGSNRRLDDDLALVARRQVDFVITSVGSPVRVVADLREAGIAVVADVASLAHAEKALAAGADGLVLLSAGAGGHTGWANPFAFARAVRRFYDGLLVLAGGVSDGAALWAAITLGYDVGYMGTRFIATAEGGASPAWRQAVVDARLDDITVGMSPTGVKASLLPAHGSAGHTVSGVDAVTTVSQVVDQTEREWDDARARTSRALTQPATPPAQRPA